MRNERDMLCRKRRSGHSCTFERLSAVTVARFPRIVRNICLDWRGQRTAAPTDPFDEKQHPGDHRAIDLAVVTFLQRINTEGGLAPSFGCDALTDVGKKAFSGLFHRALSALWL